MIPFVPALREKMEIRVVGVSAPNNTPGLRTITFTIEGDKITPEAVY